MNEPKGKFERFDDYLSGEMPSEEADSFEEALFDGAHIEEAVFFDGFRRSMRFAVRFGPIGQSATREDMARFRREGVQMHVIDLHADGVNAIAAWEEGLELVVTRIHVDARGYDHIDVQVEQEHDGVVVKVFHETGCDPSDGNIYALCEEMLARAAFVAQPEALVARVLGKRDGKQTEIARFRTAAR